MSDAIVAATRATVQIVIDAFNAHDPETAVSMDLPEFASMVHGQPNKIGIQADLDAIRQQVADPAARLSMSDEQIDVAAAGDLAVFRATYRYTFTDPVSKTPTVEVGNWIAGLNRQPDGVMKLAWAIMSDTAESDA